MLNVRDAADFLAHLDFVDDGRASRGEEQHQHEEEEEEVEEDLLFSELSKKYIADDTREGYQKSVMRLVIWLYGNERRCLYDTSVSELNDIIVNLPNANELGEEEEEQESEEPSLSFKKYCLHQPRPHLLARGCFNYSCRSDNNMVQISNRLDRLDVAGGIHTRISNTGGTGNL